MTARAIVSGALYKVPECRTSRSKKPYATFTIKETMSGAARWWKGISFSESTIEALLEMRDGEPISACGEFDAELYTPPGGEVRVSWKITADAILSARAKPKPRQPKAAGRAHHVESGRAVAEASWASPAGREGPDDGAPF